MRYFDEDQINQLIDGCPDLEKASEEAYRHILNAAGKLPVLHDRVKNLAQGMLGVG